MEKERRNEIAYGVLVLMLSKQDIELDPDKFKRKLGNLTALLAKVGVQASAEEVRDTAKSVVEDLVKYAFDFPCKGKK